MSDTHETCEYVLDPDKPETWGGKEGDECYVEAEVLNEEGVWSCPHDAEEGEDLCIFHKPVDSKDSGVVMEALSDALNIVSEDGRDPQNDRANEFIGAKFESIELEAAMVIEHRVRLDHTHIRDGIDAEEIYFKNGISAKGFTTGTHAQNNWPSSGLGMEREARLEKIIGDEHHGELPSEESQSERNVSFRQTEFGGLVEFDGADLEGARHVSFAHTVFYGDSKVSFEKTKFTNQGHVAFNKADFENQGDVSFEEAVFKNGDVSFSVIDFANDGDVWFRKIAFQEGGNAVFYDSDFINPASVEFTGVTLDIDLTSDREDDYALEFTESRFTEDVEIGVTATNDEMVSFVGTDFSGANLTVESLPEADFHSANLTRVDLSGVDLTGANLEKALLNQANLFDTTFAGARLEGTVFGDSQVNEGTFENLEPDTSTGHDRRIQKWLRSLALGPTGDDAYRCVYDPASSYDLPEDENKKEKRTIQKCEPAGYIANLNG